MSRALILGARSVIAQALAHRLAEAGWDLILAARNSAQLQPVADHIGLVLGRHVALWEFDAVDLASLEALPARISGQCGDFHLVALVFGYMGDQLRARASSAEMERTVLTNFAGAVITLSHIANYLENLGEPATVIGISSVAGDRGRQSNYLYGASKGGLSIFLQGLRNRLADTPVHVLTVKPGFVDTPMTEDLDGLFLVASPERVAADILRAVDRKTDVLYTPWFWRYIMLAVRLIPERLFKRLKL